MQLKYVATAILIGKLTNVIKANNYIIVYSLYYLSNNNNNILYVEIFYPLVHELGINIFLWTKLTRHLSVNQVPG